VSANEKNHSDDTDKCPVAIKEAVPPKEYVENIDRLWPKKKRVVFSKLYWLSPTKRKCCHTSVLTFIFIIVCTDEIDETGIKNVFDEKINQKIKYSNYQ
jgi:hypothetical protein